jgi:hypothetical protein
MDFGTLLGCQGVQKPRFFEKDQHKIWKKSPQEGFSRFYVDLSQKNAVFGPPGSPAGSQNPLKIGPHFETKKRSKARRDLDRDPPRTSLAPKMLPNAPRTPFLSIFAPILSKC